MNALVIALTMVVLLLAVLVIGLLQSHAAIVRALDEAGIDFDRTRRTSPSTTRSASAGPNAAEPFLPNPQLRPGDTSPAVAGGGAGRVRDLIGVDFDGNPMAVAVAQVPRATLLAFLSSGCLTCHSFWEGFADPALRASVVPGASVVVVTKGPEGETAAGVAKLAGSDLLTIMSSEAWDDYSVPVAPYFMLVDGTNDRVIGEGSAATFAQLANLMERAQADFDHARARNHNRVSRRGTVRRVSPLLGQHRSRRIMSPARLTSYGLSAPVLPGWDVRILRRTEPTAMLHGTNPAPSGGWVFPMIHASTVTMPPLGGDYGSHVIPLLGPPDVFIAMVEFDSESAGTPLFPPGRPRVSSRTFDRNTMQRVIPGMSGTQKFFSIEGRAFALFCVLGSHLRRSGLAAKANSFLSKIEVQPR